MQKTLMASAAVVGLVIGMAGAAHGQANPNQDKRPGNERVEKNTPAENAGQRRADEMKPGQNMAAEKRAEEQRAGQAEATQKRAEEQRAGQAEATQKRAEEQRAGQADAAQKRAAEQRNEATNKRAEENRANQAEVNENRMENRRDAAERRDLNAERRDANTERRDANAARRDANMERNENARLRANAVRVEGRIRTSEERADRISAELMRRAHRENIDVAINVGARLPDNVAIEPLPPDVVEIAPEYRGYDYVYVNDRIVFVQPSTHEVVGMIDIGDNAVAQGEPNLSRARPCPTED